MCFPPPAELGLPGSLGGATTTDSLQFPSVWSGVVFSAEQRCLRLQLEEEDPDCVFCSLL